MRRPAWLTFRRFAAFTAGLTGALVVLGVYTAATGAGLACSQQWPLCDGGVLPATLPSFIEWFHRLVAMVTGWFILGTAVWAWRGGAARRTALGATVAAVLLPLQVSVGAVTVTLDGALPWGYSTPVQSAHLLVALSIFTALVVAALSAYEGAFGSPPRRRSRLALWGVLAALLLATLAGRVVPAVPYTPPAQAVFVGASLAAFAGLLAATRWLPEAGLDGLRSRTVPALLSVLGTMLLGRDLVVYTDLARAVNWLFVVAAVALVAAAIRGTRPAEPSPDSRARPTGE